jgi:hypothetical protein
MCESSWNFQDVVYIITLVNSSSDFQDKMQNRRWKLAYKLIIEAYTFHIQTREQTSDFCKFREKTDK